MPESGGKGALWRPHWGAGRGLLANLFRYLDFCVGSQSRPGRSIYKVAGKRLGGFTPSVPLL